MRSEKDLAQNASASSFALLLLITGHRKGWRCSDFARSASYVKYATHTCPTAAAACLPRRVFGFSFMFMRNRPTPTAPELTSTTLYPCRCIAKDDRQAPSRCLAYLPENAHTRRIDNVSTSWDKLVSLTWPVVSSIMLEEPAVQASQ
jgi:hypothetical protein